MDKLSRIQQPFSQVYSNICNARLKIVEEITTKTNKQRIAITIEVSKLEHLSEKLKNQLLIHEQKLNEEEFNDKEFNIWMNEQIEEVNKQFDEIITILNKIFSNLKDCQFKNEQINLFLSKARTEIKELKNILKND